MKNTNPKKHSPRNNSIVDPWSFIHLFTSAALTLLFGPIAALVVVTLWEPVEIFVISPLVARRFGVLFGHETALNSVSDMAFNLLGILLAMYVSV